MSYDILEHQHRFAIWTAARAVQRSFTKTIHIETAINSTTLRSFSETEMNISSEEYHYKHQEWTNIIIKNLSKHHECSYGRAAKIIAVYLKTAVIIPEKGMTQRCDVIYPPIDRVILQSIAHHKELKDFSKKVWTQFDEERYNEVANRIRNKFSYFNWRIEEYWNLKDEEISLSARQISDINETDQILFDGYCPESFLNGKRGEMKLNNNDFWESVETGLQIAISEPFATILKWRGKGNFRKSSVCCSSLHSGLVYSQPSSVNGYEFLADETKPLLSRQLLENYITSIEKSLLI